MALQQQAVLLHHPPDALMVPRRRVVTLLGRAAQDGVDAAIAVGWHVGDHGLDPGEQVIVRPRRRGSAGVSRDGGACQPQGCGDGAHREPSRPGQAEPSSSLFGCGQIKGFLEDFGFERLLGEQPLQLAHLLLQGAVLGSRDHFLAGGRRGQGGRRRQVNSWFGPTL